MGSVGMGSGSKTGWVEGWVAFVFFYFFFFLKGLAMVWIFALVLFCRCGQGYLFSLVLLAVNTHHLSPGEPLDLDGGNPVWLLGWFLVQKKLFLSLGGSSLSSYTKKRKMERDIDHAKKIDQVLKV